MKSDWVRSVRSIVPAVFRVYWYNTTDCIDGRHVHVFNTISVCFHRFKDVKSYRRR